MAGPITDATLAEALVTFALAGNPAPTTPELANLMTLAASLDEDGNTIYTEMGLNRAVSLGWQNRASIAADQYDLGGGGGKSLDRSQWFDHCMRMAAGFADGTFSVLGSPNASDGKRRRGMGVIGLTSSMASEGTDY